jgi:hypothetical protein
MPAPSLDVPRMYKKSMQLDRAAILYVVHRPARARYLARSRAKWKKSTLDAFTPYL